MHLNYHMNFIFHVDDGRIIGVSVYPVRDRFQYGKVGSLMNLHGPVRWFRKQSFNSLSNPTDSVIASASCAAVSTVTVISWCFLSILLTVLALALLYIYYIKPNLAKRYLKAD